MSDWVNDGVPGFAVVGRVNMGKSAVIATLLEIDDNELVRVSATPGETTRCQSHRVVFGGRECLRFIDTPGFSRPVEAMKAIQQLHGDGMPSVETLRRFVLGSVGDYVDERRLLEPLLDGAGVLYVVDTSKPLRDDFLAEMEILRWTGRPRLALVNRREKTTGPDEEAWKARLGASFNLVRTFDAHQARYDERLRLLRSLLEIEEHNQERLKQTILLVESEWQQRREEAVEIIIGFLEEALALKVRATLEERDLSVPSRQERKMQLLTQEYFAELAALERRCFGRLLKVYRHHLLKADTQTDAFREIDLQSEESWTKWGLGRGQLAAISALFGGSAGLAVDAAAGGLTHGVGTVFGILSGGLTAWFKGGSLPDLRLDLLGGIQLAGGEGKSLSVGPPKNPNFPWVLLDGVITRYQRMLCRAHGRRDEELLRGSDGGFARGFPSERRNLLGKWFSSCLRGAPNRSLEPEVFRALVDVLEETEPWKMR